MTQSVISMFSGSWGFLWALVTAVIMGIILTVVLYFIPQSTKDKWEKQEKEYQPKNKWYVDLAFVVLMVALITGVSILVLSNLNIQAISCANCTTAIAG